MRNLIVRPVVACAFIALLAIGSGELRAGPLVVTRVDGTIGKFTLVSPNPDKEGTAVLTFNTLNVTMFNGQAVPDGITTQLDRFIINLTPVAGPAGYTTFSINPSGGFFAAYQFRMINLMPGGGTASFGLFGNTIDPPGFQPNAILIPNNAASVNTLLVTTTGTPRYNGNNNYNFTNLKVFSLSLTAPNVDGQMVNLATIIQKGGTATGTGTFSLTVPEPSSFGLLAVGATVVAVFVARRPRR
jgi:PEP-CTERM motif